MRVKPTNPAVKVPYPGAGPMQFLPEEGAEVPDIQYWRRRLLDGDIAIIDEHPAARPAARHHTGA
jgi:hypothetical protein